MSSSTVVYLAGLSPVEQERRATLALGEMAAALAPIESGWSYREARIVAGSIVSDPGAFGLSPEFSRVELLAARYGVVWHLAESDPLLSFRVSA